MITKRIGKWSWALSAEERLAAAVVERAEREKTRIAMPIRRRYDAMLKKQKKLDERAAAGLSLAGSEPTRFAR